jgi:hypothetical protein
MGYSHDWYRPLVVAGNIFDRIRADFERLVLPLADMGIPLAGWGGENEPEISNDRIRFNGVHNCGHPQNDEIVIPYPAEHARGVGPSTTAVIGPWFNMGVELRHRCCNGHCDLETFSFPKIASERDVSTEPGASGLVFNWTKTAFRPYDIAVTAALLVAKRYLRDQLIVLSAGADAQWADAKELCQRVFGYGSWFGIIEDSQMELRPGPKGSQVEREVRVRLLVEMDPVSFELPDPQSHR